MSGTGGKVTSGRAAKLGTSTEHPDEPADGGGGYTEQKPNPRENGANLPEHVKPLVGVIPHVPAELAVDNAADRELKRGDNARAGKAAQPKASAVHLAIEKVDKRHASPAGQRHRPVRKAAEGYLKKAVQDRACPVSDGAASKLARERFFDHMRHRLASFFVFCTKLFLTHGSAIIPAEEKRQSKFVVFAIAKPRRLC